MNFELTTGIAVLERTPSVLHAMLGGLPAEWTSPNEGLGTWSAHEVVGHLIHGERTDWIPRARIILSQHAERRFTPFDRFAGLGQIQETPLTELLSDFARLRAENLATLAEWCVTDVQLGLTGEHPELGQVTLRQLLATWVAHDLGHLGQISRVMARQYRDCLLYTSPSPRDS